MKLLMESYKVTLLGQKNVLMLLAIKLQFTMVLSRIKEFPKPAHGPNPVAYKTMDCNN